VHVHARIDPPDDVLSTAAQQGGVISAEQLILLGFNLRSAERLVNQRSWQRLATGLYHLGAGEPSWEGLAWGGVFLGGPESRLGFDAAGHLWELVQEPPHSITVLVPHGLSLARRGRWEFRQERAGARSARSPGSPPRTTIEDTVLDLCSRASARDSIGIVTAAVQTQRTTAHRIATCIQSRRRVRHRQLLTDLLSDVTAGAESPLEMRYLRDVERAHGLPRARRQVRSRSGKEVRDMLYEEFSTVIELDGRIHIPGRFRDMRRDNSALLSGRVTLRYGWPDVTDRACAVVWQVATLLAARGWAGVPTRCARCEHAIDADLRGG
jgi:very-short-patch-repair endonuclease